MQNDTCYTKGCELCVVEVHGLAESRPSVPKGDRLYAKESGLIHVWRVDPMYPCL